MDEETLVMAKSYVDNQRKKYIKTAEEVLVPETKVEFQEIGDGRAMYALGEPVIIVEGGTWTVIWDGLRYNCTAYRHDDVLCLGNAVLGGGEENTGEPFFYGLRGDYGNLFANSGGTHTFSVSKYTEVISDKYLPGPVVIDLPIDKDTLFSGNNIPVDDQMVETLEKAATNHSIVYVQITGGSTMVLPFNLAIVQSGQDYKYYTFCCVSVDMSTVSYFAFMINLHTGDKTINGKATSIKGIFA